MHLNNSLIGASLVDRTWRFFFRSLSKTFPPLSQAGCSKSKMTKKQCGWPQLTVVALHAVFSLSYYPWAQAVPRLWQLYSGRAAGAIFWNLWTFLDQNLVNCDFSKMLIVAGGLIGGYSDTTEVISYQILVTQYHNFNLWHGIAAVRLFQYWHWLEGGRTTTLTKVQSSEEEFQNFRIIKSHEQSIVSN